MRPLHQSRFEQELYGAGYGPVEGAGDPGLRTVSRLFLALWRARYLVAGIGILGGIVGYALSLQEEERYTSYAQVMIDTRASASSYQDDFANVASRLPTTLTAIESELQVLRSIDLVERVVQRLNLYDDPEFSGLDGSESGESGVFSRVSSFVNEVRDWLKAAVQALTLWLGDEAAMSAPEDGAPEWRSGEEVLLNVADNLLIERMGEVSAVFSIGFRSEDPLKAAEIANVAAEEYIASQSAAKLADVERTTAWFTTRTKQLRENLSALNDQLEAHETNRSFSSEAEMEAKRRSLLAAMADLAETRAALEHHQDAGSGGRRGAVLGSLNAEQLESVAASLENSVQLLQAEVAAYVGHAAETRRLEAEIEVTNNMYDQFASQLSRYLQQENYQEADARLIRTARPPTDPSEPNRKMFALVGAALGFLTAGGTVLLMEVMRRRLRSVEEIEEVAGLPVIGMTPRVWRRGEGRRGVVDPTLDKSIRQLRMVIKSYLEGASGTGDGSIESGQHANRRTKSGVANARGAGGRIIAGVSAEQQEGKSTTVRLMARSLARSESRTLLLDCDLWASPHLTRRARGELTYEALLEDPSQVNEVLLTDEETGLDTLPALRVECSYAGDVLASVQFQEFLSLLRRDYDYIVVDTPPILAIAEAVALARYADATIFLVLWNRTTRGAVSAALRTLATAGVRPMGLVATQVKARRARSFADDAFAHSLQMYSMRYQ